jgi:hypothetical protein
VLTCLTLPQGLSSLPVDLLNMDLGDTFLLLILDKLQNEMLNLAVCKYS